jgi:hypothetical protein
MWKDTHKKYRGHPIFESPDGCLKYVENINGDDFIMTTGPPGKDGVYTYYGPVLVSDPTRSINLAGRVTRDELGI